MKSPEAGMETLIINPTAEDEPIIEKAQELVPQAIPSISETVPESISELIPESIPELITESVPELIPAEPQLKNIPFKPCEIKLARCCVCETVNNLRPLKPTIIPVLKRQKKEFHWQENRQNFICLDCIIVVNSSEEIYRQSTLKNERFLKGGLVQQKKTESKAIPTATSNRKKSPQSKKRPQKILKTDDKIVDDFVWIDRFPCPFLNCDFASDRIQVASQHCAFTHKLFPFYYCKKCNQRFICEDYLDMHLRAQSIFDTSQTICYKCGKEFWSIYSLVQHFECHSKSRNFPCTLCRMFFLEDKELQDHLNSSYHVKKVLNLKPKTKSSYFQEDQQTKRPASKDFRYKAHIKILKGVEKYRSRYPDKYWYFGWQLGKVEEKNCKQIFHKTTFLADLKED